MKRVEKKMLAASRFRMGTESIVNPSIYSKAYTGGSDPFEAIKLCKWNGLDVAEDSTAPLASVDVEYAIVSALPIDEERIRRFEAAFAILNSPGAILRFAWLKAFLNPCL